MAEIQTWTWKDWDDGSGHLVSPDGKSYFDYDWATKEYKVTPDTQWDSFLDADPERDTSLAAFKEYAENYVRNNIVRDNSVEVIFDRKFLSTDYDPIEAAEEAFNGRSYEPFSEAEFEFTSENAERFVEFSKGTPHPLDIAQAKKTLEILHQAGIKLTYEPIIDDIVVSGKLANTKFVDNENISMDDVLEMAETALIREKYNPFYKTSDKRPEFTTKVEPTAKENTIPERALTYKLNSYKSTGRNDAQDYLNDMETFRTENPRYDSAIRLAQASYLQEAGYEDRADFDRHMQQRKEHEMTFSKENIDAPQWLSEMLLTDEEQEYAYSEEFKEKFGDWKKAIRLEKLRNSYPIEITGKEIAESTDLKEFKKNAIAYGKTLTGSYRNKDTGNEILLTASKKNGGIYEILEHDYKDKEHLQSVSAIPQIIENSIYLASEKNEDVEKHPNVSSYDYYVCGLRIGNEDYTVKSVISNIDGKRYYDHKLTAIEKGRVLDYLDKIESVQATSVSIATQTPEDERLPIKDIRLLQICQCPQKAFVDINQYDWSASSPTKEAVQAVRNGTLYHEVDADGFEILHDEKNGIIYGQELRNIVCEQLHKENKALKEKITERAVVNVDGHDCVCAHGLEQGAENAIRRVNELKKENSLLRNMNKRLSKENEKLRDQLQQDKSRAADAVTFE